MILSCPKCATSYRADPQAIGAQGRRVRCISCGHEWKASPEAVSLENLPEIQPVPERPAKPVEAFRARAEERRRQHRLAASASAWGGVAVAVVGAIGAAFLFRADVVSVWPKASSAYAAVGIDANVHGVAIGPIQVSRVEEDGLPAVVIEGEVRNFDLRSRSAPPLRASLLDAGAQPLLEWTVLLEGGALGPGERRAFRTVVTDPPQGAVEVEMAFAAGDRPRRMVEHDAPPDRD